MVDREVEGHGHAREKSGGDVGLGPEVGCEGEAQIGRLTIRVEGQRPGVRITLDGRDVPPAVLGVERLTDPGHHVVRVLDGETQLDTEEVLVPDGGAASVTVIVPASEPVQTAGPPRRARHELDEGGGIGPWWLWTGIAVLLSGAAAAAFILLGGEQEPTAGNFSPGVLEIR